MANFSHSSLRLQRMRRQVIIQIGADMRARERCQCCHGGVTDDGRDGKQRRIHAQVTMTTMDGRLLSVRAHSISKLNGLRRIMRRPSSRRHAPMMRNAFSTHGRERCTLRYGWTGLNAISYPEWESRRKMTLDDTPAQFAPRQIKQLHTSLTAANGARHWS